MGYNHATKAMKVANIMQREVEYVTTSATVREVSRYIFGRGINGLPICTGKKVVGFVTERDILDKLYPSMQEYIEDPVHEGDFEAMEERASEILALPVTKIMSKDPLTISEDTPLLRAQSLMAVHKVGRLPVVDDKGNLIGILSKGDIFRAVVGQKLPFEGEEGFYDHLAQDFDELMDWKKRLSSEIPDLTNLFKREGVKRVIDVGSSTGEHVISLAKNGFQVTGLETSSLMHKKAMKKIENVSETVQKRITLLQGNYSELTKGLPRDFGAALFMGNALPHVMNTDKNILREIVRNVDSKKGILVFQIINFYKVLHEKNGFRGFVLRGPQFPKAHEHAFFAFYRKANARLITDTWVTLEFDSKKWRFRWIDSTPIIYVDQKSIIAMLKKVGFSNVSFYGSQFYEPLFKERFDPLKNDWMTVVAKRR